ncbi:phage/plasmid primase, P4 family [Photobacterium sp. TLY01]|uniref:phage/plasmid primase, P4 family n=1 Tax=Photobacterium sp. TLY01 TaxID=2907534 RepID=UPI001F1F8268|nr:phage/plasmid primase, P4 family [Photobacterium sp. TLY01]UIP27776.1 phage/plasmid primase, P4 family [Photobacterium sp. TLY01]
MDESRTTSLKSVLLIPIYSENNSLQSLQAINAEGKKFFMKGGKMTGGRFTFPGDDSEVYVCEGYATGATVHEATGATVVVAFNAGGLEKIVPNVVNHYPDSKVIIAADNDHRKAGEGKGNKGLEVAKSTAEKLKVAYTLPTFEEADTGTDWNDYAIQHGIDATTKALVENEKVLRTFANFDETIKALLADTNDEEAFDAAICFVKDATSLQVGRLRARLKDVTGVNVGDINKAVAKKRQEEEVPSLTHGEIANEYIAQYNRPHPVCEHGYLWAYCKAKGIWLKSPLPKIGVRIAEQFKHEKLCQREGDYKAIASHTYNTLEQKGFFDKAPKGIHIPSGFMFIEDNQLKNEPPTPQHRARFRLSIEPDLTRQPEMLLQVLREAFEGCHAEEQIRQLRMMIGLALFGLQAKEQRAVLLYGAAGSGKSLFLKLIEALVPKEYRTSVSPLHMDNDYKVAALAGKLMNLVPEIDKDKPVPSAEFKAITGGDTMSAREPYGKVFTFTPEAACWFNGNYYLTTKDNSEEFWRRWTIFHFANSKPEQNRDPKLLAKIVEQELPTFLAWAINGVQDYLENGLYLSPAHHACIQEWKRDGNSVSSWLSDMEDNGVGARKQGLLVQPLRISHAYTIYKDWCRHNNRKPYNKTAFKGHMESCGHPGSMYNGYSSYIGLYDARPGSGAMAKVS